MKTLMALLASFAVARPPCRCLRPAVPRPSAVPFATVQQVALTWAATEFPGASLGTAVPYVDQDGNTVAYMFHFRTDGGKFPAWEQVAADVQAERQTLTMNTEPADVAVEVQPHAGFGAARPVAGHRVRVRHFRVLRHRGPGAGAGAVGARLDRDALAYLLHLPSTYLEFADGRGGHFVVSEHFERTWTSREAFTGYVTDGHGRAAQAVPGR